MSIDIANTTDLNDDNTSATHTVEDLEHTDLTYFDYGIPAVVTLSFFLVLSMILAVVGNVMVIITIVRHRGMRTRTNILLGNLAVADILVAVLDMPIALATVINHDWMFSYTFCVFNGFTVGLGLMLSVHTLMWISIHKFLSITRPFERNVTMFQIVLMMICIWTWTILYNLTATPLIGMTQTVYKKGSSQCGPIIPTEPLQRIHSGINTVCNLVVPMAVMVCCYYKIFKTVKDHLDRMRDFADAGMRNSFIQQKQITETLCIVLFMFFLFWAPYIVYSMSLVFCGEKCVPLIFNPISYLCGYMNSACNPVIYALRSQSFRRGFMEIIFGSPAHLPGSVRRHRGIIESFRRPTFKKSEEGRRATRRNGITHPATTHLPSRTPARTPSIPVPKLSICTCERPFPPEANGNVASEVEMNGSKLDSEVHESTIKEKIQFEVGSRTRLDLTPTPSPTPDAPSPPWQPLQVQATEGQLTRSCVHLVSITSTSITRSSSAGEILDTSHHFEAASLHEEAIEQTIEVPKRRHFSDVHRPLMWQASVDYLTPLPAGERRRQAAERRSVSQQGPQMSNLGVRTLLCNLRRSFSDLLNLEQQQQQQQQQQSDS